MNVLTLSTLLMPNQLLPIFAVLLLAVAGIVMTLGGRQLAKGLIMTAIAAILFLVFEPFISGLLAAVLAVMPWWMVALFVLAIVLSIAGRFFRDVAVHVVGDLTSGVIRWAFTSRIGFAMLATAILGGGLWASFG